MNVTVAKHAGFCFGVNRAVQMVEEQARTGNPVYTLGPIIHNRHAVARFEAMGVHVIETPEEAPAGSIDGANRFQKMLHVTWPGIRGTVCIMLILQIGSIMGGASFDQIFNLYSSPVYPVADIIDTYVYRQSFSVGTNFGYTTAIGLLKSVIGVVMVWSANKVTTKMGEDGLF